MTTKGPDDFRYRRFDEEDDEPTLADGGGFNDEPTVVMDGDGKGVFAVFEPTPLPVPKLVDLDGKSSGEPLFAALLEEAQSAGDERIDEPVNVPISGFSVPDKGMDPEEIVARVVAAERAERADSIKQAIEEVVGDEPTDLSEIDFAAKGDAEKELFYLSEASFHDLKDRLHSAEQADTLSYWRKFLSDVAVDERRSELIDDAIEKLLASEMKGLANLLEDNGVNKMIWREFFDSALNRFGNFGKGEQFVQACADVEMFRVKKKNADLKEGDLCALKTRLFGWKVVTSGLCAGFVDGEPYFELDGGNLDPLLRVNFGEIYTSELFGEYEEGRRPGMEKYIFRCVGFTADAKPVLKGFRKSAPEEELLVKAT